EGMLHPVAQLGQNVRRYVLRGLGDKVHADAFRADQPHHLFDLLEKGLGGILKEEVRLVEEKHELGAVEIPCLGQVVIQVGQQPHHEGGEEPRLVLRVGQLETGDDPATVGGLGQQVVDVELWLAKKGLCTLSLELDHLPQQHADRRLRHSAV